MRDVYNITFVFRFDGIFPLLRTCGSENLSAKQDMLHLSMDCRIILRQTALARLLSGNDDLSKRGRRGMTTPPPPRFAWSPSPATWGRKAS